MRPDTQSFLYHPGNVREPQSTSLGCRHPVSLGSVKGRARAGRDMGSIFAKKPVPVANASGFGHNERFLLES